MKIILTGCTGFTGGATLHRCLAHRSITSIVVLTRRPLSITHPKLTAVITPSFLEYTPESIAELQGAEACIWCMGTPTSGKEVHVDFTFAATTATIQNLVPALQEQGKRFRFVYVSGILCEKDQNRTLWFLSEARKMRGGVETSLVDLERESKGGFQAMSVRPSGIHKADTSMALKAVLPVVPSGWHISVEEFAAAMVELAIRGDGGHFVKNDELKVRGRGALEVMPM